MVGDFPGQFGNDILNAGNDLLVGGEGADGLHGDHVFGGDGDDSVVFGEDRLVGGSGDDFLFGDLADDVIETTEGGDDFLNCGSGTDFADGGPGWDTARGCETVVSVEKIVHDEETGHVEAVDFDD